MSHTTNKGVIMKATTKQILVLESMCKDVPREALGYVTALESPNLSDAVENDSLKMLERHIPGITVKWKAAGIS